MTAGVWDITIEQGATWSAVLTVTAAGVPTDLTGHTARMQARETAGSATILLSLTTEVDGGITINGPAGTLTLTLSDEATAALDWTHGVYDLELVSPAGEVTRLVKGQVTVDPEVTR